MKPIAYIRRMNILALMLASLLNGCRAGQFVPVTTAVGGEVDPPSTSETLSGSIPSLTPAPTLTQESIKDTPKATKDVERESTHYPDCYKAEFISDVTIPDGSEMTRDEIFLKIWRLKNVGDCVWPADLILEYSGGDALGHTQAVAFKAYPDGVPLRESMGERAWADLILAEVQPGESIDVPLILQAPSAGGDYFSVWSLRSPAQDIELVQIYVQIHVDDIETPEPTIWGGEWMQLNLQTDGAPTSLFLEEDDFQVRGYFYTQSGELYLLEGGLFDQGMRVEGTFGPPYHDGFPFTWQLEANGQSFQGSFQDQLVSSGAWCGTRNQSSWPDPCELSP